MEILIITSWLIITIIIGILGADREIGGGKAFFISLFLSPLIGAIFVATSPKMDQKKQLSPKVQQLIASASQKYQKKDYAGAIKEYQDILTLHPLAPHSNFMLASIYAVQQKKEDAYHHLSKAVEQGFADFEKIQSSSELQFLRSQPEFKQFAQNGYTFSKPFTESQDVVSQLERLGKLKQQDLLTEEEFQSQKRRLLGS